MAGQATKGVNVMDVEMDLVLQMVIFLKIRFKLDYFFLVKVLTRIIGKVRNVATTGDVSKS